ASLVNGTIIRLEYMDGAVEHWKVIPGIIDCIKNYYKFGSLNRNLLWWNKKGIGSFFMTSYKHGGYESYKAWNYSDSAKEPVYK
ncbi:MAG: hypothetical protein IJT95_02965, partial [Abditibacteriota bacterium]|nr:hypothetical protein [Abditibacteriota bacterium]